MNAKAVIDWSNFNYCAPERFGGSYVAECTALARVNLQASISHSAESVF